MSFHFIYKYSADDDMKWQATADSCAMVYPFMAKTFGPYPYNVYSFLHGGGGGTEKRSDQYWPSGHLKHQRPEHKGGLNSLSGDH